MAPLGRCRTTNRRTASRRPRHLPQPDEPAAAARPGPSPPLPRSDTSLVSFPAPRARRAPVLLAVAIAIGLLAAGCGSSATDSTAGTVRLNESDTPLEEEGN